MMSAKRRAERKPGRTLSYLGLFQASPLERVALIKRGIPAAEAKRMFAELAIGQGAASKALGLSQATVNKKAKHDQSLAPDESERVVGMA